MNEAPKGIRWHMGDHTIRVPAPMSAGEIAQAISATKRQNVNLACAMKRAKTRLQWPYVVWGFLPNYWWN